MSAATVSRWARGFVASGALALVAWRVAALAGTPRRVGVVLGVFGFVLHVVFGKAYSLVPSYFDRQLAVPRAPALHLPLSVGGTALLAADALGVGWAGLPGAVLWAAGVAVFLLALGWTLRDNPLGRETGTGDANAERRPVDRAANAAVPAVLGYLLAGTYATLAVEAGLPTPVVYPPAVSHLLAAGTGVLLVFAVGFRLFPRFLVARPPRTLVAVVLPTGVLGPAILATALPAGPLLPVGAAVESVAVVGFAAAYVALFARSERRRVGFYAVLGGVACGTLAALLGVHVAFARRAGGLVAAHFRLAVLGFLGLTIVGASYQFYPPSVGTFRGAGDRTAFGTIALLLGGVLVEAGGLLADATVAVTAGRALSVLGALGYAGLLVGLFWERHWSALL